MKASKLIITLLVTCGMFFISIPLMAQSPPPGGPGSTSGPIDGGVTAFVIGAAAYGYKKIKEKELDK